MKAFIREHADLFWYIPDNKKEDVSEGVLVETILNYGDLAALKKMFFILGVSRVAFVFFNSIAKSDRHKGNYHELTLNYFTEYFKRNVPEYSK